MKNFTMLLGFGCLMILSLSCSRNQPEKVASKFLEHVQEGELEKAGKLGTKKTEQFLELMASTGLKDSLQQPGYIEFREIECKTKGDTAHCNYQVMRRGTEGPEKESLKLVKKEEGWRINMEKEELDKVR